MLCETCKKRTATVFYNENMNGKVRSYSLCGECAAKLREKGELQDITSDGKHIYERVAELVNEWNKDTIGESGYGAVGAVVGATYPEQAKQLRTIMKQSYFLVPGYGAQGGGAQGVKPCFNDDGLGAVVNSSRAIMCAYKKGDWKEEQFAEAARAEAIRMKDDITSVL